MQSTRKAILGRLAAAAALVLLTSGCKDSTGPTAPAAYALSGIVTDLQGQPLRAWVQARQGFPLPPSVSTDPLTGAYTIGGLSSGTIEVTAGATGYRNALATVVIPTDAPTDFRLRLSPD